MKHTMSSCSAVEYIYIVSALYKCILLLLLLLSYFGVFCPGVLVTSTVVTVTSGAIREGTTQTVGFNLDITADRNGGSVSGSDLWQVTAFGSLNSNGNGDYVELHVVTLNSNQGSTHVTASSTSTISGLVITWDLADGAPPCADFDYFCVQLDKNPSSSIDFELTGQPSDDVLTSCQIIDCRGNHKNKTFVSKLIILCVVYTNVY